MKLSLKKIAVALTLAGACAGANATTTPLGPLSAGAPTSFQGTVFTGGVFTDIFTFDLPANGGSGYSVLNFPLEIPGLGSFNTVFSMLLLVSNPDGIVGNGDDSQVAFASGGQNGLNALSLTFGPTAAGSMYLAVSGLANGTFPGGAGLYSGAISVASVTAPVPEPGTWAMLGLGVGMMGFALRRKMR